MDIEMLKEMNEQVEKAYTFIEQLEEWQTDISNHLALLGRFIDEAIAKQQATSEDTFPSAIKWTGKNLREVIDLTGWNESASSKWTWAEYEQVVEEKGLKIFTPSGSVMADIGDWIIYNGKDCYVTTQKNKTATTEEVQIEINRLQESLNQTKEAAKELKEQKYTVNMLPVYNQIKSLELQITALQAYQPWIPVSERLPESDDGHQNLVLVLDIGGNYEIEIPSHIIRNIEDYTHWMPLPEPPKGETP